MDWDAVDARLWNRDDAREDEKRPGSESLGSTFVARIDLIEETAMRPIRKEHTGWLSYHFSK